MFTKLQHECRRDEEIAESLDAFAGQLEILPGQSIAFTAASSIAIVHSELPCCL